jgi:hypothetical protein
MPRFNETRSVSDIIEEAVHQIVDRTTAFIADAVRQTEAQQTRFATVQLDGEHAHSPVFPAPHRRADNAEELTRWIADRRARRVPNFVIALTGLDTKKKIVARYGENAVFEKGRPLPKPHPEAHPSSHFTSIGAVKMKHARARRESAMPRGHGSVSAVANASQEEASTLPAVSARPPIIRKGAALVERPVKAPKKDGLVWLL